MTRILLTGLFAFFITLITSAQFNKGAVLLGGGLFYNNNNFNDFNGFNRHSSNGSFVISAGKATNEKTVFGINLNYSSITFDNYYNYNVGPLKYKSPGYGIGIFYRKYKDLGKEFYLFGEAGAGYIGATQSGKNDAGNEILSGHINSGNIYLMPGIAYRISKIFFLELTIPNLFNAQYTSINTDVQQTPHYSDKGNSFYFNTSLSSYPLDNLAIGFRLVL